METRWFDRRFEFGLPAGEARTVVARLRAAPERLAQAARGLPHDILTHRPGGRWSIQEHAGHLGDLEALWMARLDDFDAGAATLRPADLQNRKTHEAGHNERTLEEALGVFHAERAAFVERLERMPEAALARTARHPRLDALMTVVDLAYFVAEHDDHHLAVIARSWDRLLGMPVCARELLRTVDRAAPRLAAMDDEQTARPPRRASGCSARSWGTSSTPPRSTTSGSFGPSFRTT